MSDDDDDEFVLITKGVNCSTSGQSFLLTTKQFLIRKDKCPSCSRLVSIRVINEKPDDEGKFYGKFHNHKPEKTGPAERLLLFRAYQGILSEQDKQRVAYMSLQMARLVNMNGTITEKGKRKIGVK